MFLPGESQGQGSLVGCRLRGHTESDTTEATQQQGRKIPRAAWHSRKKQGVEIHMFNGVTPLYTFN